MHFADEQYCWQMGKGGEGIKQPNAYLRHLLWTTSWLHSWCPDACAWWRQLPESGWHPPSFSGGYDRQYRGGNGWWWWESALNSKGYSADENMLPKFELTLQMRIIRQQRYLEVIGDHALGVFGDYEQSLVADNDVASLHEHAHIVNAPAPGSLGYRKCTRSHLAAN